MILVGSAAVAATLAWLRRSGGVDRRRGVVVGLAGIAAVASYAAVGRPGLADAPYAARLAELEARFQTDIGSLTPPEALARLQDMTRTEPEAAEPHFFIGELLRGQGRDEDAVRAYQSALRRDPNFAPALTGLADSLVRLGGGEVGENAQRLYARAYALNRDDVRAGFMAGLADWQAGETALAETAWGALTAQLPADDPRRAMVAAWTDAARAAQ